MRVLRRTRHFLVVADYAITLVIVAVAFAAGVLAGAYLVGHLDL